MPSSAVSLFTPITIGTTTVPNRVFMAPLTRSRSTKEHVPTPIMAEYYKQRASAGLLITEATGISQEGLGWPYAPGIWSETQTNAWKPITDAVHNAGGRIFVQLWHMGRVVHPSFNNNLPPVAPSAITAPGLAHTYLGKLDYVQPRELSVEDIKSVIEDYRQATRNAIKAGFDGVQIHAANGYLIDQFLRDSANNRTDNYGGSIENRIRLLLEVTKAVIGEIGAERTSVRLSPNGEAQGVNDSNPLELFTAAAKELSDLNIAFLEIREPDNNTTWGFTRPDKDPLAPSIRKVFKNTLVLNSDYEQGDKAQQAIESGVADAITFGRAFLANPDLPHKLANKIPLNKSNPLTYYTQDAVGYTDYSTSLSSPSL